MRLIKYRPFLWLERIAPMNDRFISSARPLPFRLPRPARSSDQTPIAFLISSTMISGGMVMPPQTRGPAMTRSGRNRGFDLSCHPADDIELRHDDMLAFLVASRILRAARDEVS